MKKYIQFFAFSLVFVLTLARAEVESAEPENGHGTADQQWQRAIAIGWHYFDESAMSMRGPELTLTVRMPTWRGWKVNAEASVAQLDYRSQNTGTMNSVPWLQTRWSALYPVLPSNSDFASWSWGPMLTAYSNDLRGITSTGHQGYERLGNQWWASLQYESGHHRLELSGLIYGEHTSKLSQAGASGDIVNKQRRGWSVAHEYQLSTADTNGWRLQSRFTHIDTSNFVGAAGWHEPQNKTFRLAVAKGF